MDNRRIDLSAEALVIVGYSLAQEVVASAAVLISAEGLLNAHLLCSLDHSVNYDRSKGLRYVADTHSDEVCFRVSGGIRLYALADINEEVVLLQIEEIFI